MPATKRDYYEILEISREADRDEIKRSYRRLAVKYHPDKNPGDAEAEDKFKELSEAYDVLSDSEKRAAYDRFGHTAFSQQAGRGGGGFHDPFDLFREVFGGGGGGIFEEIFAAAGGRRSSGGGQRGDDLRFDLEISLEEVADGCEKEIEMHKLATCSRCQGQGAEPGSSVVTCPTCRGAGQVVTARGFFQVSQTCPSCRGAGRTFQDPCRDCRGEGRAEQKSLIKLRIPAGIENGSRLRSTGNGESGIRGGGPGDLYVVVHVKDHAVFERDGDDLYCEVPISFATATLGGEVTVPTLKGKASVKVPAGTQGGTIFRLKGKGITGLHARSPGDLLARVAVEVPTKLNHKQREALQAFSALCGEENQPLHKGFLDKAREFFR